MRILMTGVTKQQCGGGTSLDYEPVAALLAKALRAGGHAVDHRVAALGESLNGYDGALVGLVPFFSIASHYLYPTLHVLRELARLGKPAVLYVDDWNFSQLVANLGTHVRMPQQLTKPFFQGRADRAQALGHAPELMEVIERLAAAPWPPLLVPAFTWGEHSRLGSLLPHAHDVTYVDVSPFARPYPIERVPAAYRRPEWVLGTVSNQLGWVGELGLAWPLNHLGTRTSRAPRRLNEAQLVQLYGEAWGVLSPPYRKILGTGWWRNRYVYASQARAVLLGDPAEAGALGDAYRLRPSDVEGLDARQLTELAQAQFDAFWARVAPRPVAAAQLSAAFQRAGERL